MGSTEVEVEVVVGVEVEVEVVVEVEVEVVVGVGVGVVVVMSLVLTSRSVIETSQKCLRLRYEEYEAFGRGLQLGSTVPLDVGSCVHLAVEAMLRDTISNRVEVSSLLSGLAAERNDEAWARLGQEDRDLVDALVRTWYFAGLPALAGWEVLDVEREENFDYPFAPVRFQSRSDWIAAASGKEIINGTAVAPGLYNWNLKTWRKCGPRQAEGLHYDAQVFTELLGPEQRLGQRFAGVIYQVLVKEDHPLVWAWRSTKSGEVVARYRWTCDSAHENTHTKAGGWCPGGKQHRLGGDYERVAVRDVADPSEWFERVKRDDPALLREFHVILGPMMRPSDYVIQRWLRQWLPREAAIAALRSEEELSEEDLDRNFPMTTAHNNCTMPSECPAKGLCWGGASRDDYGFRVPNHPEGR